MIGKVSKFQTTLHRIEFKKNEKEKNVKGKMGIYLITNTINGHKYVGQSNNIYRRWKEHRKELRLKRHSQENK